MKKSNEEVVDEKLNLIKRNLQEVIGEDIIKSSLEKNETMNVYWGTAPTGRPHVAYFLPMIKLADFLKAECFVTILFADLHAYLDSMKTSMSLLGKRTEYYEVLIKGILKTLNIPVDKLRFIRGMDFQLSDNYTKAVYQIIGITSIKAAKKAGSEVVRQNIDCLLSSMVYPLLQALDEEFLGVDAQFGGVDQRKTFIYAEKYLPLLNMAKRVHLMNPMIPGLTGEKMSASEEAGKIDLLDSKEMILKKLKNADINGLLAFLKYIALPIKTHFNNSVLNKYDSFEEINLNFKNKKISEKNLKKLIGDLLWSLISPLKEEFLLSNNKNLVNEAYPDFEIETNPEVKEDLNKRLLSYEEVDSLKKVFPNLLDIAIDSVPKVTTRPSIMWSCRATGEPHIGYLIPIKKLAQMSNENWNVIILIEDIGAYLLSKVNINKPSFNLLKERSQLYIEICRSAFYYFNGNFNNLEIVLGSEFQFSKQYALLMYQAFTKVTESECTHVLKKLVPNELKITNLSSLIYPVISVLDQYYLEPTVRLFGEHKIKEDIVSFDKRLTKIFSSIHKIPLYISHRIIHALDGKDIMNCVKMESKVKVKDLTSISICDTNDIIHKKMEKTYLDPENLDKDPTLEILENIIWPQLNGIPFCVKRTEDNRNDNSFSSIDQIKTQLKENLITPGDIKEATSYYLSMVLLDPICSLFSKDIQSLLSSSFPIEIKITKTKDKAFKINKVHLKVAIVESVVYKEELYNFTLKCGIDKFTFKKHFFYNLTPNDYCIIVLTSSTNDNAGRILGILTNADGIYWNLVKKAYKNDLSFQSHETLFTHLRELDTEMIVTEIETNIAVKGKYLIWIPDGSVANEIEFKTDNEELTKVCVSLV